MRKFLLVMVTISGALVALWITYLNVSPYDVKCSE